MALIAGNRKEAGKERGRGAKNWTIRNLCIDSRAHLFI